MTTTLTCFQCHIAVDRKTMIKTGFLIGIEDILDDEGNFLYETPVYVCSQCTDKVAASVAQNFPEQIETVEQEKLNH